MYTPDSNILYKYASVLVDFALNKGGGIHKGDVVYLQYDAPAHPLAVQVYKRILEKGGHPITKMSHEDFSKILYTAASDDQLDYFPKKHMRALIKEVDHRIYLIAHDDPLYLKDVPPEKIMKSQKALRLIKRWLQKKEDMGRLTWTLALYGTKGMAVEAGISEKEYWDQIIGACFLNEMNPIQKWQDVFFDIKSTLKSLNALPIKKVHVTARDTDLWLDIGTTRKFIGGEGANIPSFEVFTSPDWRGTTGKIFFDLPLYRYGAIVKDIYLEFKQGKIVMAKARKNEKLLHALIQQKNANKIGEFSLTDRRYSHITTFMAQTLYDENFGGKYGNMHLAVGSSYHETYRGNKKDMKKKDWDKLGFNESIEHTDIIATHNRVVEVILTNGIKKIIYKNGEFVF